jgi:hypothetical protein
MNYTKIQEWEDCVVKIQSPRSHKMQRSSYKEDLLLHESSLSLKARKFSLSRKLDGRCEGHEVLNS